MAITIDTTTINRIKSVIGYPRIEYVFFRTDDEIKDYVLDECLRTYFNKFPIKYTTQTSIGSSLEVPFPDEYVFGITNIQVAGKGGGGGSSDSFWDVMRWQMYTGYSMTGQYGVPRFNPNGQNDSYFLKNRQLNTVQNQLSTQDARLDLTNRKLKIFSGVSGYLLIDWAKFSLNFTDIKRERFEDVVKICRARLLELTGKAVGLLDDSDLAVKFNPDAMKSEAKEMWDEVMTRWADIPDVVYYRAT